VGLTANLENRFLRHNFGYEKTTKPYAPFILIFTDECEDRITARSREKYFKTSSGKRKLREIRDKLKSCDDSVVRSCLAVDRLVD
jgi:putative endonuclease